MENVHNYSKNFQGDLGGPVYQHVLGRTMLVGVYSNRPSGTCNDFVDKVTGQFVDIRPHSKWITSRIRGRGLQNYQIMT